MSRADQATGIRVDVFADPDLSARLKLFTLAAIHLWETKWARREIGEFRKESWPYVALRMSGETGTTDELSSRLRWLIADDVPKYRMPRQEDRICVGTMLRPAGAPCKRRATTSGSLPNPLTGERSWIGACSDKRHKEQFSVMHRAGWSAWRANGEPAPKPNSGGILLRYFNSGIEALYAWADRDYTHGDTATPPPVHDAQVISLADRRARGKPVEEATPT